MLGFKAFFMAGSQTAAFVHGLPDVGIITLSDAIDFEGFSAFEGFTAVMIWGYGPGMTLPMRPPEKVATSITPDARAEILISYDPTNGSTSFGDIYATLP